MKEVKNEENSPMYLTGFDLEKVAQFCSLFKKSLPPVCVCVTYFALQCSQAVFELCVVLDQLLCVFLLHSQGSLQRVLCGLPNKDWNAIGNRTDTH